MKQGQNMIVLNLAVYFPELIELANGLNINWDKIDELFSNKIEDRLKQAKGGLITVDTNLTKGDGAFTKMILMVYSQATHMLIEWMPRRN